MFNYKETFAVLFLCLILTPPLSANKKLVRRTVQATQRQASLLPKAATKNLLVTNEQAQRLIQKAVQEETAFLLAEKNASFTEMRLHVLALRENKQEMFPDAKLTASSFVIEETFKGKKQLWGVTAAHIVNDLPLNPGIVTRRGLIPITFAIQGSPYMTDIALFPIPQELVPYVRPLELAHHSPATGTITHSFGFFNNGFHLVPNRKILESTPSRLITSLEFKTTDRGGACGGPLLNAKNQVVGVHIGSSSSKHISYAVPVEHIHYLLAAYHNKGKYLQPLLFRGKKIGEININEAISTVQATYQGRTVANFNTFHQEKQIDYTHLETLFPPGPIDELYLYIKVNPLNPYANERPTTDVLYWSAHTGIAEREPLL